MIKHHNFEQKSDEWINARLGKITGSGINQLFGTSLASTRYLSKKASEILTNSTSDSDISNLIHVQRGLLFEREAREKYTLATFTEVDNIGLIELDDYTACSPDGLVGADGIIEIKVPDTYNYLSNIFKITENGSKGIAKEYYEQMQFNLYVSRRQWCDYIMYNPFYSQYNDGLFIYRVEVNYEMQSKIKKILAVSIQKIQKMLNDFNNIVGAERVLNINMDSFVNNDYMVKH